MKQIAYERTAATALRKHRAEAKRITDKIERYAKTGIGDVTQLKGSRASRLRVGITEVLFEESETTITVTDIAPRGRIYS
jgi:mRNA interferase RelE/StbE